MERILVGVDDSEGARTALEWSAQIARRSGLELVAVRAVEPTQGDVPAEHAPDEREAQRRELEQWCEALPEGTPRPRVVLVDRDPADALPDAASEHQADLSVVGGRGSGGFAGLHVGSVAHHLAHHTTTPLAIIPAESAPGADHLVLGVDGSKGSLAAVELCAELAAALDVSVTAVHAFEPFVEWVPEDDPRSWRSYAEREVQTWVEPLTARDVPVDVVVDRDINPAGAIGRAVEDHPGSTAVVGTRGLAGFPGLRLGRVPLQLVHQMSAPVIVVPAPSG